MNIQIMNVKNKPMTSTKNVADMFNKDHKDILRKLRKLLVNQPEFGGRNFAPSSYLSLQNKVLPSYDITRDGFAILAMSLTGREAESWKIKYINAFNAMESSLVKRDDLTSRINELDKKIELDAVDGSHLGLLLQKRKAINKENSTNRKELMSEIQSDLFIE